MAINPELVLGYTPIIIILTVQLLGEPIRQHITKSAIEDKIAAILRDENEREKVSVIFSYLRGYIQKREKLLLVNIKDKQFIQELKAISRNIMEKGFPEEKEYFDFLFDN